MSQYDFLNQNSKLEVQENGTSLHLLGNPVIGESLNSESVRTSSSEILLNDEMSDFNEARIRSTSGERESTSKDAVLALPPKSERHLRIVSIELLDIQKIAFLDICSLVTSEKPYPSLRLSEDHKVLAKRYINLHTSYQISKKIKR
jgi:hypothetical protein